MSNEERKQYKKYLTERIKTLISSTSANTVETTQAVALAIQALQSLQ